jgi:hypothetical protein
MGAPAIDEMTRSDGFLSSRNSNKRIVCKGITWLWWSSHVISDPSAVPFKVEALYECNTDGETYPGQNQRILL